VLYISNDKEIPVNNLHKEVKINEKIKCSDITPDCICDIELNDFDISHSIINEKSVEVSFNVGIEGVAYDEKIISPVVDISLSDETEKKPSLTVYFADEGEKLWDIAKKYGSSVETIKAMNKLESDKALKGTRLIIPKMKKSC
jgi:LysM repeat protein